MFSAKTMDACLYHGEKKSNSDFCAHNFEGETSNNYNK